MKKETDIGTTEYFKKHISGITNISKLAGDASTRDYFRISRGDNTFIAMVYPENVPEEIDRIRNLTEIYREAGLKVPGIIDQFGENVLLQEDIGDVSLQEYLKGIATTEVMLIKNKIRSILEQLKRISPSNTDSLMDLKKMMFEIDFFIDHFVLRFFPEWENLSVLREDIEMKLSRIHEKRVFAHRDFHSRNIFVYREDLYLIDFQDSLRAPEYYDMVSFVFDSYLGKKTSVLFRSLLEERPGTELDQIYLTSYQRNVKALGTFGYQDSIGNRKFFDYILPAIENIRINPHFTADSPLGTLFSCFKKKYMA